MVTFALIFLSIASYPSFSWTNKCLSDLGVVAGLDRALTGLGLPAFRLPSGAGHDTMVMGGLVPSGMLFVRCQSGVSHNPAESITPADGEAALRALTRFAVEGNFVG